MTPPAPRPVTPVSILADTLVRITDRLDGSGVEADVLADLRRATALAGGLDDYTGRLSTPESEALAGLAERTAAEDWGRRAADGPVPGLEQEMLSGHLEGQLLKMLVHVTGARRVLEVGMFTGYSALAMAEALHEAGVTPGAGAGVVACELDPGVAAFAQDCFTASPAGALVDVRVGPAADTLHALAEAGEVFDLVFVDADKGGYADYLSTLLDRELLAPDALVCVDNTLMQGDPWLGGEPSPNGAAIAHFNQVVAEDPRVTQVVLPVRDGITLIRRVDR